MGTTQYLPHETSSPRNDLQFIRVAYPKSHTRGNFGGKIGRYDIHESRLNLVTGKKKKNLHIWKSLEENLKNNLV